MTWPTTVRSLVPGDIVVDPATGKRHTFVVECVHPIWRELALVVWKMADGTWMHDALGWDQEIFGQVEESTPQQRMEALRRALLGQP